MVPHGGSLIAGRFQPLETVRAGVPIKARDLKSAQTVLLHQVDDLDRRLIEIFHPSLLTIFDIVRHDGRWFAACEFVPARPLNSVLAGEPCHPKRAAEIVCEIADAVAELHARGISHGEISSSTVYLTLKGKSKLSLTTARTAADPQRDVAALRLLLEEIAGRPFAALGETDSAPVLAALLRNLRANHREEPP
jgi:hypothetical protein